MRNRKKCADKRANKHAAVAEIVPSQGATSQSVISFADAVSEGRDLITVMNGEERRIQLRLGELYARVERKYGDRTLAKFAKEIGVAACTLERYHSVFRAWEGIPAPGPVSYAVMRELQDHPQREEIVKENPKITKREAQKLKREREGKQKNNKSGNWRLEEAKRWFRRVCSLANEVKREMERHKEVARALREIVEPELLATLVPNLREGSAALLSLADHLEHEAGRKDVAA